MNHRSLRVRATLWYASLLAASLLVFGASAYLGLERYLYHSRQKNLSDWARSVGEKLLVDARRRGDGYVVGEINESYAPEINSSFIRVTRGDGKVIYQSTQPKDGTFDSARVSHKAEPIQSERFREETGIGRASLLIDAFPFVTPDGDYYLIETGASLLPIQSILHGLLLILAVGMPIVVAGAIGGGYLLMRRALLPLDEITRQAERVSLRSLSDRLQVPKSGDELERLAITLNRMLARLEDSFHHVNRFSADASHELRTPLTILRGELEAIARGPNVPPELLDPIGSALEETDRLGRIIDHLLVISRLDAGAVQMESELLNVGVLARSTAEQMHLLAEEKGVAVQFSIASGVETFGDPARLKQVIVNLLDNAIKYTPENGHIDLSVAALGDLAVLEISDDGVGISESDLPHVFERFFRADKARSRDSGGAGLGLSIAKAICAAHNGSIHISSEEGKGTHVRVELPLANGATPSDSKMQRLWPMIKNA